MHRGHPPLRRHRSVSTLVEASGLCAEEGTLSAGQSVSAKGVTRAKRAASEVWVGTPVPVDYPRIDGRPLSQQMPRQPSQGSRPVPRAKEKSLSEYILCMNI